MVFDKNSTLGEQMGESRSLTCPVGFEVLEDLQDGNYVAEGAIEWGEMKSMKPVQTTECNAAGVCS